MVKTLKLLLISSSAELLAAVNGELASNDYETINDAIRSNSQLAEALANQQWDIAIADYGYSECRLPALLDRLKSAIPLLPVIIFTRTELPGEIAAELLRAGACDLLSMANSARLLPVIERELGHRERAAQALRNTARASLHTRLLDSTNDAILMRNLDRQITFWNKGAERLYGWSAAEVVGQTASLLYRENSLSYCEAERSVVAAGEWRGELQQTTRAGEEIWVRSHWQLIGDHNQPPELLIINTDITEQKRLAARLLQTQRLENVGALAGGIAHDLNNVLSPILMSLQIMRRKFTDEESRHLLEMLETSAARGANLVRQILSFTCGMENERMLVQLCYLINEVEKIVGQTFPRSIMIVTDISEDLWPVMADGTQICQALLNLAVNARDDMPRGGQLTIKATNVVVDQHYAQMNREARAGRYVNIIISDTGVGRLEQLPEQLFEPSAAHGHEPEAQLGLVAVAAIVRAHNGFITTYGEAGKGLQFKIYLPAAENAEADTLEELPLPAGRGELVLVVDDEETIREVTRTTLEAFGYQVLTANDGTEAIALYAEHRERIRVVVLDMMMPFMDGVATIRALQKLDASVKIIAASGMAANRNLAEAVGESVREFLPKPFNAETLICAVARAIKQ